MASSPRKRILLIDDDHGPMDYYVDAIREKQIEVLHLDDVDEAWKLLHSENFQPPDLFVIDIMMPYGLTFTAQETNDGMETGYPLIDKCRRLFPETPIICLSNVEKHSARKRLDEGVVFYAKYETSPLEFADTVSRMVEGGEDKPSNEA